MRESAPTRINRRGCRRQRPACQRGDGAGVGGIEHGDQQGEAGEPVLLAGGGQVRGHDAGDDAAGAHAHHRRAAGIADPLDRAEGAGHRGDAAVQAQPAWRASGLRQEIRNTRWPFRTGYSTMLRPGAGSGA
jgi:hypothetical protein